MKTMEFSRPKYWSGWPFPSPGDLPNPGIESRSPELQVDSLPSESPGKPKNTRVSSPSLLQWIPTQELNWGLLHCSQILYQLSYQFSSVQSVSHVQLFVTPWTAALQASLSITTPRACSNSYPLSW